MSPAVSPAARSGLSTRFHPLTVLASLTVVALLWVLYADVLAYLAYDWWTVPAYSHGLLLPPFALYVAWLRRRSILACPAVPDPGGIAVSAIACVMYLLGNAAAEYFLTRMSFVILLTGLIWTFWGLPRLRELAFSLLLLATMIPLPAIVYNGVAAPLQLLASNVAFMIASAAGVSIFRDGNILHLAGGSLGVAEACSGLNSLSSLLVGSVLIGFVACDSLAARLVLICLSIPVAIAVNVVRVAGTAILADFDYRLAMGFYHSLEGWLVFVAGAACLYGVALIANRMMPGRNPTAERKTA